MDFISRQKIDIKNKSVFGAGKSSNRHDGEGEAALISRLSADVEALKRNAESMPVQWVQGHCISAISDPLSFDGHGNLNDVNAIIAIKHDDSFPLDSVNLNAINGTKYYPLLRGITDVPTQGDPVLLCKFGEIPYYLGPLNTGNNPNFNFDYLLKTDSNAATKGDKNKKISLAQRYNINPAFPINNSVMTNKFGTNQILSDDLGYLRLQNPITDMDYSISGGPSASPFNRSVGDMLFEGRFGNSLRIGGKLSGWPFIVLSNGRNSGQPHESLEDANLMMFTKQGSIGRYFSFPQMGKSMTFDVESNKQKNTRGVTNNDSNRKISFASELDSFSKYKDSQSIIISDRIIFNARHDLILSSARDMYIGTASNFRITTKDDVFINSRNIYLGKDVDEADEQMVLGNTLVSVMLKLINAIGNCNVGGVQPSGFSVPIKGFGSPTTPGTGWNELESLKSDLTTMLSEYAYLKKNKGS